MDSPYQEFLLLLGFFLLGLLSVILCKLRFLRKETKTLKVDPVTGLYRRNARTQEEINKHLLEAKRNGWSAVVMVLDLDRLKIINDTCGHFEGDRMLNAAALAIQLCVRPSDLLYRWGGDEFIWVFTFKTQGSNPLTAAYKLADRILKCFKSSEYAYPLSVSLGCGVVQNLDFAKAFGAADIAMYKQKQRKKNAAEPQK